jgi:hypothetical protein
MLEEKHHCKIGCFKETETINLLTRVLYFFSAIFYQQNG